MPAPTPPNNPKALDFKSPPFFEFKNV